MRKTMYGHNFGIKRGDRLADIEFAEEFALLKPEDLHTGTIIQCRGKLGCRAARGRS